MSYDICILPPSSYASKSHKLNKFKEADHFLRVLERTINEWNFSYLCEDKIATAHKIKFNHLEKVYLSSCNLVLYVVCSSSRNSFEGCLQKLVNTCHKKNITKYVVVVSLEKSHLNVQEQDLDVIYFGDNSWETTNDQWGDLARILEVKIQDIENTNSTNTALSLSIPNHNHSNKLKTYFHSLKLDLKKEKFLKQKIPIKISTEDISNIKLPGSNNVEFTKKLDLSDFESQSKKDKSKLSLNSLFRKRPKESKYKHINLDSPTSTCSADKKSDTASTDKCKSLDGASEPSPSSERSEKIVTSLLRNSKNSKATMHAFKDKANKVIKSANCIHSPQNKRKKHVENALSDVAFFSSFVISASSDLPIDNLKFDEKTHIITSSFKQRCKSEPPINDTENISKTIIDNIKYYSWSEKMIKYGEFIPDDLIYNNMHEIKPIRVQGNNYRCSEINEIDKHDIICLEEISCLKMYNNTVELYSSLSNKKLSGSNNWFCSEEILEINVNEISDVKNDEDSREKENIVSKINEDISLKIKINNHQSMNENENSKAIFDFEINKNNNSCLNGDKDFEEQENISGDDELFIHEYNEDEINEENINCSEEKNNNYYSQIYKNDVITTKSENLLINKYESRNEEEIQDGIIGKYYNFQYIPNLKGNIRKYDESFFKCKSDDLNVNDIQIYSEDVETCQSQSDYDRFIIRDEEELEEESELFKQTELSFLQDLKHPEKETIDIIYEHKLISTNNQYFFKPILDLNLPMNGTNNLSSSFLEISDSIVINPPQSYITNITHSLIKNPTFVATMFTAAALTAPIWSKLIPHNTDIGLTLYHTVSRFLQNDMVQSIPNELVSVSRVGTVAVTSSLKRFFIVVPNNNILISGYKILFC